jgi:hypothetical protein
MKGKDEEEGKISAEELAGAGRASSYLPPQVAQKVQLISDLIDENLRLFRLSMLVIMAGSAATLGFAFHVRLLRRYRRVQDIPSDAFRERRKISGRLHAVSGSNGVKSGLLAVEHIPPLFSPIPSRILYQSSAPFLPMRMYAVHVEEPGLAWLRTEMLGKRVQAELLFPADDCAVVLLRKRRGLLGLWSLEDVGQRLVGGGWATFDSVMAKPEAKSYGDLDFTLEVMNLSKAEQSAKDAQRGVWRDVPRPSSAADYGLLSSLRRIWERWMER